MFNTEKIGMVIPAAGTGSRMATDVKKQYIALKNKEIIQWTLESIAIHSIVDEIILVVGKEEVSLLEEKIKVWNQTWHCEKSIKVVFGGANRQESVYLGLKALGDVKYVFIHDGVRPFAKDTWLIQMMQLFTIDARIKGMTVGTPSIDTLKHVDSDIHIIDTLNREEIYAVQTPQLFEKSDILSAHQFAKEKKILGTDDASLIELTQGRVKIVCFDRENIKITTPFDLLVAEAILSGRLME